MECPICKSLKTVVLYKNLDKIYKVSHYAIHKSLCIEKCLSCGQVFTSPQLGYGELKNYFSGEYLSFGIKERGKNLFQIIQSFLKKKTLEQFFGYDHRRWWGFLLYTFSIPLAHYPNNKMGKKILDIGCGSGNYLAEVEKIGWDVYGIDPSDVAVNVAKGRGLKNIYKGDAIKLPFEDNFFDVISIFHVFEHVPNPQEVLNETKRVLKPGGILIIGVPNFSSLGSKIYGKYWAGLSFPLHYFFYTQKTLGKVLTRSNFDVLSLNYSNLFSDIFTSSPESFLSPIFNYAMPAYIRKFLSLVDFITGNIDYIFGNIFAQTFHLGSQITIVSRNKK